MPDSPTSAPLDHYVETDPAVIFAAYHCVRTMGRRDEVACLLLDGPPGTGKTFLARHLARALGAAVLRFQFYEGCGRRELLVDEDFATPGNPVGAGILVQAAHASRGPRPAVLILDEIDKADPRVDGFLLNFLSEGRIHHPQLGEIAADPTRLLVVITKNDQREVTAPLLRRCRVVDLEWPTLATETRIARQRFPWLTPAACAFLLDLPRKLRRNPEVRKAPSTPEVLRLIDDLADFVPKGPDAMDLGTIYIRALTPYPEDRRHVEKSPLFYGTRLLEAFAGLARPAEESESARIAAGVLADLVGTGEAG